MKTIALWWRAVRPFSITASVVPVVLGTALAIYMQGTANLLTLALFLLTVMGVTALHFAGNLINDYYDHQKGIDREGYGSRGILVTGEMTPRRVMAGGITLVGVGIVLGIVLALWRGPFLFVLGLAGVLFATLYSVRPFQLKYRGVGDVVIILAFGPLVVLGAYMVQTQTFSWIPVWASIPITLLVDAILHANNTRDMEIDRGEKIITLAGVLGDRGAALFYDFLIFGAYVSVIVLVGLKLLTPVALATLITFPLALKLHKEIWRRKEIDPKIFAFIDARTAQLHLSFGGLLSIALIVALFLR